VLWIGAKDNNTTTTTPPTTTPTTTNNNNNNNKVKSKPLELYELAGKKCYFLHICFLPNCNVAGMHIRAAKMTAIIYHTCSCRLQRTVENHLSNLPGGCCLTGAVLGPLFQPLDCS
jgi:hypothetical protein